MARIAIISLMHGSAWGGSEYLWTAAAAQALTEGHEVAISLCDWSVSHPLVTQLEQQGAKLFPRPRFPKPSLSSRIIRKLLQRLPAAQKIASQSFYKSIFDFNPDVICINQGNTYGAVGIPDLIQLLNTSSIPYSVVCHFNTDNFYWINGDCQKAAKSFFTKATCVAFVSNHNLKLAERQLTQSLSNAVVVQNPVNLGSRDIVPWFDQSTISFANVARLDIACKGQDVLLEALSSPSWKERNWQCNLYGSGPDCTYLKSLAQYYGISDRIHFKGHVNDVQSIWRENHILVLPSRGEGTPLSVVEAMLCGRPAIVSDVGGNAEWITEAQTGFVADAPTAKLFNAALERAWQAQDQWKQMGIQAHKYATEKFDKSPGKSLLTKILDAARP